MQSHLVSRNSREIRRKTSKGGHSVPLWISENSTKDLRHKLNWSDYCGWQLGRLSFVPNYILSHKNAYLVREILFCGKYNAPEWKIRRLKRQALQRKLFNWVKISIVLMQLFLIILKKRKKGTEKVAKDTN